MKILMAEAKKPLPLQYLKFSELIWFLRRNSCKIIILLWHFPYQKQNFLRKLFLLLLFSPIDSKLSNPYTKHVYLNKMLFNISLLGFALNMIAHFTGWGYFWNFSRFLRVLGTQRDHPGLFSSLVDLRFPKFAVKNTWGDESCKADGQKE